MLVISLLLRPWQLFASGDFLRVGFIVRRNRQAGTPKQLSLSETVCHLALLLPDRDGEDSAKGFHLTKFARTSTTAARRQVDVTRFLSWLVLLPKQLAS